MKCTWGVEFHMKIILRLGDFPVTALIWKDSGTYTELPFHHKLMEGNCPVMEEFSLKQKQILSIW